MLLLLIATDSLGQYFNKRYDFNGSYDWASSIIEINDGFIIEGYSFDSSGTKLGIGLLQINNIGDFTWKKSYYSEMNESYFTGGVGGLIKVKNGIIISGGVQNQIGLYNSMLFKFTENGDSIWLKEYLSIKHQIAYQCKQTHDGGFILVGSEKLSPSATTRDAWVLKADSLGNKEWEKSYPASGDDLTYSIILSNDGGYLLSGATNSFGAGGADAYILKIDSLGNKEWQQTLGSFNDDYGATSHALEDGGYLSSYSLYQYDVNGFDQLQVRVAKIDSIGNVKWEKGYGDIRSGNSALSITQLNNGNYAFCITRADTNGIPEGNGFSEGAILILNENGDSLNYTVHRHQNSIKSESYLWGSSATTDGGLIGAGMFFPSAQDTGTQDMWVVKMDEWGCLIPGCEVGLDEKEIQSGGRIRAYPNPFNEYAIIEVNATEPAVLKLYDATAKLFRSTSIPKGITYIELLGSEISPGIWFCALELNNGNRVTQKLVKTK